MEPLPSSPVAGFDEWKSRLEPKKTPPPITHHLWSFSHGNATFNPSTSIQRRTDLWISMQTHRHSPGIDGYHAPSLPSVTSAPFLVLGFTNPTGKPTVTLGLARLCATTFYSAGTNSYSCRMDSVFLVLVEFG
jgi:hypothetical protein